MQTIELTVKNLDDAATTAAEQLGVSPDQVKITVLEESKKLFGKVSYKVKAEAKSAPSPKAAKAVVATTEAPAPAPTAPTKAEPVATTDAPRKKLGAKKPAAEEPVAAAAPVEATAPKGRGAKAPAKSKTAAVEPTAEAAPAGDVAPQEEDAGPEVVATKEDAAKLEAILNTLAHKSGLEAEIVVGELQGKYINLSIDGKEAGYLVGKNGEVLNSLQYLINLVAKQQLANGVRVTLDGNDYRKKRAEALTNLASKIAEKVKERGEEAVLEALPAFERRVIHKALQEIEGVTTYSEGEEPDRRVVIAPLD
jgi:spoIIIJ-associated protein